MSTDSWHVHINVIDNKGYYLTSNTVFFENLVQLLSRFLVVLYLIFVVSFLWVLQLFWISRFIVRWTLDKYFLLFSRVSFCFHDHFFCNVERSSHEGPGIKTRLTMCLIHYTIKKLSLILCWLPNLALFSTTVMYKFHTFIKAKQCLCFPYQASFHFNIINKE